MMSHEELMARLALAGYDVRLHTIVSVEMRSDGPLKSLNAQSINTMLLALGLTARCEDRGALPNQNRSTPQCTFELMLNDPFVGESAVVSGVVGDIDWGYSRAFMDRRQGKG